MMTELLFPGWTRTICHTCKGFPCGGGARFEPALLMVECDFMKAVIEERTEEVEGVESE